MAATIEQVLDEIKALPPTEMRRVWERLTQMFDQIGSAPPPAKVIDRAKSRGALEALDGKFAGSGMLQLLFEERAHDLLREQARLETYLAIRHSPGDASS